MESSLLTLKYENNFWQSRPQVPRVWKRHLRPSRTQTTSLSYCGYLSSDSLPRHKKQKSFLVVIAHVCVYWCFCPNTDTMTPYLWRIPILDSGVAIRFYLQTDLLALIWNQPSKKPLSVVDLIMRALKTIQCLAGWMDIPKFTQCVFWC